MSVQKRMDTADQDVKEQIWTELAIKRQTLKNTDTIPPESYILRFTIHNLDGSDIREFRTKFRLALDAGEIEFSNGCISLVDLAAFSSAIKRNTPETRCFDPILSRESLPTGISPTDVLQVLSTKLKFTALKKRKTFTISDVARLENVATGKPFKTPISRWRIVRGEPTLYEKYGYTSDELNTFRTVVQTTPWSAIMDQQFLGQSLDEIATKYYPGIFQPDVSIANCMKRVSLEDTERFSTPSQVIGISRTIVTLIIDALTRIGHSAPKFELTVSRDSEVWKAWDARLQFVSFEREEDVAKEGATGGGSAASRRQKRTRRNMSRHRKTRRLRHIA